MSQLHVAIISSERPQSIDRMEKLLTGLDPTWYVPQGQMADYIYAGATHVQEVLKGDIAEGGEDRPTISDQRNVALDDAAELNRYCVMFNDDLAANARFPQGFTYCPDGDPFQEHPMTPEMAIEEVVRGMNETGARLGGCAATTNKFFMPKAEWGTKHFIMGQMMVVAPGEELRFKRVFGSKEDYDYTCQHLETYGRVCRANRLLGDFKHNEKRGGWANYRSLEEQRLLSLALVERWHPHVVHNPRRDGEVLIKWKG